MQVGNLHPKQAGVGGTAGYQPAATQNTGWKPVLLGTQVGNLCYVGLCYFAAASSAFFRSSTISFWMLPGVGRYFENSIVNTPCPCVMLRRSVE